MTPKERIEWFGKHSHYSNSDNFPSKLCSEDSTTSILANQKLKNVERSPPSVEEIFRCGLVRH